MSKPKFPTTLFKGGVVSDDPAKYRFAADEAEVKALAGDGFLPPKPAKAEKAEK